MALLTMAAIPLVVLAALVVWQNYAITLAQAAQQAMLAREAAGARHEAALEGVRQLLAAASQAGAVRAGFRGALLRFPRRRSRLERGPLRQPSGDRYRRPPAVQRPGRRVRARFGSGLGRMVGSGQESSAACGGAGRIGPRRGRGPGRRPSHSRRNARDRGPRHDPPHGLVRPAVNRGEARRPGLGLDWEPERHSASSRLRPELRSPRSRLAHAAARVPTTRSCRRSRAAATHLRMRRPGSPTACIFWSGITLARMSDAAGRCWSADLSRSPCYCCLGWSRSGWACIWRWCSRSGISRALLDGGGAAPLSPPEA